MTPAWMRWAPMALLSFGAVTILGVDTQRSMSLEAPLQTAVGAELLGYRGRDITISDAERRVAGVTDYLLREYHDDEGGEAAWFSLYVGYYDRQMQGRTIHSPRNCLPGGGWEALANRPVTIVTASGDQAVVNRYLLQKGQEQVLVLYWYQGRGRVQSNEYWVKWDLLRDAALKKRTEEALVRIVVPIVGGDEEAAFQVAERAATEIISQVETALPG